jgi:DNA-binding response OmpR family regulator
MPEVLLVDDDPDIRAMLAFTLDDYGFTIREAGDGVQALHALAEHAPDVMVLDLMMPNIDGFGVLAEMRDRNLAPTTRVLILSCKVDERDFVRGYELGADEYVTKPFDPDGLARVVEKLAAADAPRAATA